jgi:hypothetical protein
MLESFPGDNQANKCQAPFAEPRKMLIRNHSDDDVDNSYTKECLPRVRRRAERADRQRKRSSNNQRGIQFSVSGYDKQGCSNLSVEESLFVSTVSRKIWLGGKLAVS